VQYNPELPEAKILPENIKKQMNAYESTDGIITKVNALIKQLQM
jgi:hypothetical protein